MKVREIPHGLIFGANDADYVRSAGLHASDLYGALYKKLQPDRYDKRDKDGKATPMPMVRIQAGMTLEKIIERVMCETLLGSRPPEMRAGHRPDCPHRKRKMPPELHCACGAGVYYSPDYLFDEDGALILGEFKCTWMSLKGAPHDKKFLKYVCQMKIYCYWLGIRKARLFVYFVNGPWSAATDQYEAFSPVMLAWEFEFTEQELQREYALLMRNGIKEGLVKV